MAFGGMMPETPINNLLNHEAGSKLNKLRTAALTETVWTVFYRQLYH